MSEERIRILQMVADKKVTIEEAERLLTALESAGRPEREDKVETTDKSSAKFLHVVVQKKQGPSGRKEDVNIRIPLALVKAGVKLGRLLPGQAQDKVSSALRDKGIDIDLGHIDTDTLNQLIEALRTMSIDVDTDDEKVRIFSE